MGEKGENEAEVVFEEIMTTEFLKQMTGSKPHIPEGFCTSKKINMKKTASQGIGVKLLATQDKGRPQRNSNSLQLPT